MRPIPLYSAQSRPSIAHFKLLRLISQFLHCIVRFLTSRLFVLNNIFECHPAMRPNHMIWNLS